MQSRGVWWFGLGRLSSFNSVNTGDLAAMAVCKLCSGWRLVDNFPRRGNCNHGMLLFKSTLGKEMQLAGLCCRAGGCGIWHSYVGPSRPILVVCVGKDTGLYSVCTIATDLVCGGTMGQGAGRDSVMLSVGGGKLDVTNVAILSSRNGQNVPQFKGSRSSS